MSTTVIAGGPACDSAGQTITLRAERDAAKIAAGNRLSPKRDPRLVAAYWKAERALIDAEARDRRAEVLDSTPSKYLPLVIREVAPRPKRPGSYYCRHCDAAEAMPGHEC